ncbi:hypothetical protein APTSU1_000503100 [Apodemus speciosus]|uniref:Uncharacterized protein n=1 Tax=Apodemus speciosus TaxID=105296 RepID=A0ABQ0ESM7_APOSI
MRFLIFALIIALLVSTMTADKCREGHSKHGDKRNRRDRRSVPTGNTEDTRADLLQPEYPLEYPYPDPY